MKNLLPKKRYSTTFGVDPKNAIPQPLGLTPTFGVDPIGLPDLVEQKNVAWRKQRFNAVLKWWE